MLSVRNLVNDLGFKLMTHSTNLNKEITGVYCCDLLSWVMSHAKRGDVWITVQTHTNIVAVASLLEIGCIIIPEGIEIDEETIEKANEEGINILSTTLNNYEIFLKLYELGLK